MTKKNSKTRQQYKSLPLNNQKSMKNSYQTPFKPHNSIHTTKNVTLSLYSFTSKKKTSNKQSSTLYSTKDTNNLNNEKYATSKKKMCSNNKSRSKNKKGSVVVQNL